MLSGVRLSWVRKGPARVGGWACVQPGGGASRGRMGGQESGHLSLEGMPSVGDGVQRRKCTWGQRPSRQPQGATRITSMNQDHSFLKNFLSEVQRVKQTLGK